MEYIYAALLLHKLGKEVNEENLTKVIAASGTAVDEAKLKSLMASLQGVDIDKELQSASLAIAAPAATGVEQKKEEKKEEKASEAAEGLSALFG